MPEGCLAPDDVDALLAGKLDGSAAERAEAHIDACAACRRLVGMLARDSKFAVATDDTLRSENRSTSGEAVTALERPNAISRPSGDAPKQIDRYTVEKKLGAGGMGIVYLAEDSELKRKVVIKLLGAAMLEASPHDRARLLREAQAMAKVSHPNVVPIFDVGVYEEQIFLAMEFIDGQDLAAWLATPRGVREVLDVFAAAGRGLGAAHRAGLVHRDFKPHNVMIAKTGEVKVTDFGLARAEVIADAPRPDLGAVSLDTPLTHTGAMVGTPAYMAPEQIRAEAVDARSDQFSFCVALYEGLYGERPFKGKTVEELFESTLDGKPVLKATRGIPARVRAAIRRGLCVEPTDRFPTMEALLAEIAPSSRNRFILAGAATIVVLGSAGVVFAMTRHDETPCTGSLDDVWNAQRAQKLEPAVSAAIGAYAKTWLTAHQGACGDDKRMACLERRRLDLDAALFVLETSTSIDAKAFVGRLPGPETCNHGDLDPAIVDPKLRALQKDLARASRLIDAGRLDDASKLVAELGANALPLGHAATLAEVHLAAGAIAKQRSNYLDARKAYDRAIEFAEKGGSDRLRGEAQIEQIGVSSALGDLDDAERWARYATATIGRLGDKSQLARVELELARARDASRPK